MNTKLTGEQRKMVAEACSHIDGFKWACHENGVVAHIKADQELPNAMQFGWWAPEQCEYHWQALVSKVAQLINYKKHSAETSGEYEWARGLESRFVTHLATNNTPEIERLAWELLEKKDE